MPEPVAAIRPSQVEEQPPVTEQQQRIEGRLALIAEQPPVVARVPTEEARWRTVVRRTVVRLTVAAQVRAAVPLLIGEVQAQAVEVRRLVAEARVRAVEAPRRTEEVRAPATAEQWLAAVGHRPVTPVVAAVTPHPEVGEATAGRALASQA